MSDTSMPRAMASTDQPQDSDTVLWRRGMGQSVVMALCTAMLAIVTAGLLAVGVALVLHGEASWVLGGFVLIVIGAMLGYVTLVIFRLVEGAGPAEVRLTGDGLYLKLPAWRSLIHRPKRFRGVIPFAE